MSAIALRPVSEEQAVVWDDSLLDGGRRPRLMVIDPTGAVTRFVGESIPGAASVLGGEYRKAGKWSHTVWRLRFAPGATGLILTSPLHGLVFDGLDGWGAVEAEVSAAIGGHLVDWTAFRALVASQWPAVATRLTANDASIEAAEATPAASSDTLEVRFGSPIRRQQADGFWGWPVRVRAADGTEIARVVPGPVGAERPSWSRPIVCDAGGVDAGVQVLQATSSPGMHGGYVTVRLIVPAGATARHEQA